MPPLGIENLDHLGLVAGMIDELGLVELTNEEIEPHCLEHVSAGQIEQRHLDSTSISVEGEYATATATKPEGSAETANKEDSRAERKLRQTLEDQNQTVRDQRKQPTAKPTFRWIMQKFQGIHWINLEGQRQISNLSDERRLIIRLFGPPVERYYYASG